MEYKDIKKIIDDMGNSNIDELNIEFPDGIKISMKKSQNNNFVKNVNNENIVLKENIVQDENVVHNEKDEIDNIVKSPMVGTFYLKPSPTSDPYVEVGKQIKKGDTLCIIEAMKLMNEIESEYNGEIIEILIKDGEPVEFGTPLFRIK